MNLTYNPGKKLGLVFAGACMFNVLFWQEKLGLNTILYDAFIVCTILYLYPKAKADNRVRWLLLLQTICLAMVIMHNTILSKIALTLVLLLFTGFAQYAHRSIWFAGGSVIMNTVLVLETFFRGWKTSGNPAKKTALRRTLLLISLPLVLAFVFFSIYLASNSVFSIIADKIGTQIAQLFETLFTWFSIGRLFFLALGFYLTGWMVLKSSRAYLSNKETAYPDRLERRRKAFISIPKKRISNTLPSSTVTKKNTIALKNENTIGVISLVMLNGLLLVVNIIDVIYVWFNFDSRNVNLSEAVHQGTELLIFSIMLAMMILLFFFKGNLNFYQKNKWLKYLAYAWIAQNSILVFSVTIRDYYYIAHYGLAYKRIGVLFFLFSVLAGLITVCIKIAYKKTNYYLFRINAWVNIALLVLSTTINWDVMIASYDLQKVDIVWIDWNFILSLSDKTLPVIDRHSETLQRAQQSLEKLHYGTIQNTNFKEILQLREAKFLNEQKQYSWLSWNASDAYTKKYFTQYKNN